MNAILCIRRWEGRAAAVALLLVATLLVLLAPAGGGVAQAQNVTFPDSGLDAAVRDALGKLPGEPITAEEPVVPTPTPTPPAPTPTPTPIPLCPGFELESQAVLLALPPAEWQGPFGLPVLSCLANGVSIYVVPAAGHNGMVSIRRYATAQDALAALGTPNATFHDAPAVHTRRTGSPMPDSLEESLVWQESRWLFSAASFDDTAYRIAPNVFEVSETMYNAAWELGFFPAEPTPTPTLTPTPTRVPSLSGWGTGLLAALLTLSVLWGLRRRRALEGGQTQGPER